MENGEARRRLEVGKIRVPGIGEVQLVMRLLEDPDNMRASFDRRHERRDVASAQSVGETLEIVERQRLSRKGHNQVIEERLANDGYLLGIVRLGEVDARDKSAG